jgi:hypothetical protein
MPILTHSDTLLHLQPDIPPILPVILVLNYECHMLGETVTSGDV